MIQLHMLKMGCVIRFGITPWTSTAAQRMTHAQLPPASCQEVTFERSAENRLRAASALLGRPLAREGGKAGRGPWPEQEEDGEPPLTLTGL